MFLERHAIVERALFYVLKGKDQIISLRFHWDTHLIPASNPLPFAVHRCRMQPVAAILSTVERDYRTQIAL